MASLIPRWHSRGRRDPERRSRVRAGRWLALLVFALWAAAGVRGAEPTREYDLKAVFLYNFATFAEWPESAFAQKDTPLVIGVLGDDPFGPVIDQVVADEMVNGRRLVVQRYRRIQDIQQCHILFVSRSEADRLERVLGYVKDKPILMVSDIERFAATGGMVGFINQGNRVQLEVNARAVKDAGLTLSSKLLRLARLVAAN